MKLKPFTPDCYHTQRMFEAFNACRMRERGSTVLAQTSSRVQSNIETFCELANLMHDHLGDSHIFGKGDPDVAWKNFIMALEKQLKICAKDGWQKTLREAT